jgi:hypothetical protein
MFVMFLLFLARFFCLHSFLYIPFLTCVQCRRSRPFSSCFFALI